MVLLSSSDVRDLDLQLDESILSFPLLKRRRDIALVHLLRVFDERYVESASIPNRGQRELSGYALMSGLHHAVRWVHQYCSKTGFKPDLRLDDDVFAEAASMLTMAAEYAQIWDVMHHLHRGTFVASRDDSGEIDVTFLAAHNFSRELELANELIAAPLEPGAHRAGPVLTGEVISLVRNGARRRSNDGSGAAVEVASEAFASIRLQVERLTAGHWWLDASWSFGPYTVGDFRKFWIALESLCAIYDVLYRAEPSLRRRRQTSVPSSTRKEWMDELTKRSGLARDTVVSILDDLVYCSRSCGWRLA